MPAPWATAVAVMSLLAFGVLVGSAVSPAGQGDAAAPIVIAVSPSTTASNPALGAPTSTPPPSTTPEIAPEQTAPEPASTEQATPTSTTKSSQSSEAPGGTTTPPLPPITHVFLIVLSDQGFNAAFGPRSQATYLHKTLTHQGELLDDYYAVTTGELANEIALVSGQGPTPQTAEGCPLYTDITPGTVGAQGQVLGSGCLYPHQTLTLADQLANDGRTWNAYIEGIGNTVQGNTVQGNTVQGNTVQGNTVQGNTVQGNTVQGNGSASNGSAVQPTTCSHPTLGGVDGNRAPSPGDPYVTWRDPFVYFHSVIDNPTCTSSVVGLDQLAPDLKTASKTPSLAYIVPDRCHDGSEAPCAPGQPSGLAAADSFLREVVPEIERSPAYKTGGLIAITFDQAPQTGPKRDSSGCCITAQYPNLPTPTPPATGTPTAGTTPTSAPTTESTPTDATPTSTSTTPTVTSTPTTTTPASTTGTQTVAPSGGGRVGLLLISRYVKPGSLDVTGEYNHFSLLASIEDLFGLSHLGYAGSQGLLVFDTSVYNAYP